VVTLVSFLPLQLRYSRIVRQFPTHPDSHLRVLPRSMRVPIQYAIITSWLRVCSTFKMLTFALYVSRSRYWHKSLFDQIDQLEVLCDKHRTDLVSASFRWMRHHSSLSGKILAIVLDAVNDISVTIVTVGGVVVVGRRKPPPSAPTTPYG